MHKFHNVILFYQDQIPCFCKEKKTTPAITAIEINLGIWPFRKELRNQREIISAMIIPTIGARKIKLAVFKITAPLIVLNPPCAIAAPANPPIKVWEDEDGIPNHQVRRFHEIAAINPEKITTFMSGPGIISLCTVLATVSATP